MDAKYVRVSSHEHVSQKKMIAHFKIVILGSISVGKTSLLLRYVRGTFKENQESTIGAAFLKQSILTNGKLIKLDIWDLAGDERFQSLQSMYYKDAAAAVLVYDITDSESFERAKNWVKELRRCVFQELVIALVGNKLDLISREVDSKVAQEYAAKHNLLFSETSAMKNINVSEVFINIASKLGNNIPTFDVDLDDVLPFDEMCTKGKENCDCCVLL